MNRRHNVLQFSFGLPDLNGTKAEIRQKITQLAVKKDNLEAAYKKLQPAHSKLFIHFEEQRMKKQTELLK